MQKTLRIIFLSLTIIYSCQHDELIPRKDMVKILVKVYLTDASIIISDFKNIVYYKDTIDYYSSTYEPLGYTKAQFDSTIVYYSKNPQEFDLLFDKVINELSKLETKLTEDVNIKENLKDSSATDTSANLWNLKTTWSIPEDGIDNHIYFKIPVKGFGTYTLSGSFQVFEDDKSINPRIIAYFYYDDNTETGKQLNGKEHLFQQDGVSRELKLTYTLDDPKVTHLTGYLLDNGNDKGKVTKHVLITNLMVKYMPVLDSAKTLYKEPRLKPLKKSAKIE